MRISDWSSDVCSSDLGDQEHVIFGGAGRAYDRNIFDYMAREYYGGAFTSYTLMFDTPLHECDPAASTNCIPFDPSLMTPEGIAAYVAANPRSGAEVNLLSNDLKTPYSVDRKSTRLNSSH